MRFAVALLPLLAVGLTLAAPVPKEEVKLKPATEKQREEVQENLKKIMIGMHAYHDTVGHFPGDIVDAKTKKPLLSWRVALLPYIIGADPDAEKAHTDLYRQFKLDEPWDSKNNKPLADKLPKVFAPTRVKAKPGETFYRGFAGKGVFAGLFEPGVKVGMNAITDGTSNTIGVIDAGEPVIWTQPGTDLPNDLKKELPKFGGMIDGDFFCGMVDGSVQTIRREFDGPTLRATISRAGGEVTDDRKLFVRERE